MRLRLRIERNELPAVQILWAIPATELKQTIAQFLERVDERIPLEGESWGLEDYAVTVGGFEALHFSEVGTSFHNEDEVVIKPLEFVDKRARTITGRDQISEDGRHLLDGVPFGRPLLKRPRRPEVRIPPRKRQKRTNETAEGEEGDWRALVPAGFHGEDEDDAGDEDEEDDVDFDPVEGIDAEDDSDDTDADSEESEEEALPLNPRRTSLRNEDFDMKAGATRGGSHLDDEEDDSSSSSEEGDTSDSSSDSSSDDSDTSSEASWDGIESNDRQQQSASSSAVHLEDSDGSPPEELPSKASLRPPREGDSKTHARNQRRREQRQLRHLKEAGILPSDAGLSDMKKWQEEEGLADGRAVKSAVQQQKALELKRQRLLEDIASGGVDITLAEDQQRQSEATLGDGQMSVGPVGSAATRNSTDAAKPLDVPQEDSAVMDGLVEGTDATMPMSPATQRRARIDLAGTRRLVFGSLGVRTPKTQADKDRLQQKLSSRPTRNPTAASPGLEQVETPVNADDGPDDWRDRIDLVAVECCDEGVELSEPPFPFKQRWDPQYQPANGKRPKRKRRKLANAAAYAETYDKYDATNGDALNYDDPEDDSEDEEDEYWEEGALLDGEEAESAQDGFPALPDDIETLPTLAHADAVQGDFVVFKELACTQATGWQPTELTRTAKLDARAEPEGWRVRYARRDLAPKQYDGQGNRVYTKFEVPGMSDDEEDDEELDGVLVWAPGREVKLLQRGTDSKRALDAAPGDALAASDVKE